MPKAALESIVKELAQLDDKDVFRPINRATSRPIKYFMFLKKKYKSDGSFEKIKARLVAGGHQQDRTEMLYEDINSPTAELSHILIVAAIAARNKAIVKTIDITGAYLNADMRSEVLMEIEPTLATILAQVNPKFGSFLQHDGKIIVQLVNALYGTVETKLWYNLLVSTLASDGFIINLIDSCILYKVVDGNTITTVIYVDGILVTSCKSTAIDQLEALLKKKFRDITVHDGDIRSYLGMTFDLSVPDKVSLTMEGYVNDLLEFTGTTTPVLTPATENLFTTRDAERLDPDRSSHFHTVTAKLLYLAKRSRPDILLAVSFLTTRVTAPDTDDYAKLQRILKYLHGSRELGITLNVDPNAQVHAFIDASYVAHSDAKSHSGLVLTLGAWPILVKSTKQRIVTKSSTEAELVALSDFASEALASKSLLDSLGVVDVQPACLHQDNMSTIAMCCILRYLDVGLSVVY